MPDTRTVAAWSDLCLNSPFATAYVTPSYFSDPYAGNGRFAVLAEQDGEFTAAVTGVVQNGRLTAGLFSRPQMIFRSGIDRKAAFAALSEGMIDACGDDGTLIEAFSFEALDEKDADNMKVRGGTDDESVVMLDLSAGAEKLFSGFSQTRRSEIRKAERSGKLEVRELETETELQELYAIYCEWNLRKGIEPAGLELMKMAAAQNDCRRIIIAKLDGHTIAGSFYRFARGGVVEYASNYSTLEHQKLRPNDLIGWHAIKWACDNGYSHFSMGGSHLFLRRFGGEIVRTYRYRRDISRFRVHEIRESARALSAAAYGRMPAFVKDRMKKVLAK